MLSFVDLEFQHLPIYFGKKTLVCRTGYRLIWNENKRTSLSVLFEGSSHPQSILGKEHPGVYTTHVLFKGTTDNLR